MNVTETTTTGPAQGQAKAQASANSGLSSDFETFLKMLTVQMQNQDPLNPIESSEYALQLATFSGVEQQVRTNSLLESLAAQFGGSMVQLAGWVGMEARADVPGHFDGTPLTLYPQTGKGAESAELVVKDSNGAEVQRLPLDPSETEVTWAGVDDDGAPLPTGDYHFEVATSASGKALGTDAVELYDRVTEVRMTASGTPELIFASGGVASADAVSALRDPG